MTTAGRAGEREDNREWDGEIVPANTGSFARRAEDWRQSPEWDGEIVPANTGSFRPGDRPGSRGQPSPHQPAERARPAEEGGSGLWPARSWLPIPAPSARPTGEGSPEPEPATVPAERARPAEEGSGVLPERLRPGESVGAAEEPAGPCASAAHRAAEAGSVTGAYERPALSWLGSPPLSVGDEPPSSSRQTERLAAIPTGALPPVHRRPHPRLHRAEPPAAIPAKSEVSISPYRWLGVAGVPVMIGLVAIIGLAVWQMRLSQAYAATVAQVAHDVAAVEQQHQAARSRLTTAFTSVVAGYADELATLQHLQAQLQQTQEQYHSCLWCSPPYALISRIDEDVRRVGADVDASKTIRSFVQRWEALDDSLWSVLAASQNTLGTDAQLLSQLRSWQAQDSQLRSEFTKVAVTADLDFARRTLLQASDERQKGMLTLQTAVATLEQAEADRQQALALASPLAIWLYGRGTAESYAARFQQEQALGMQQAASGILNLANAVKLLRTMGARPP